MLGDDIMVHRVAIAGLLTDYPCLSNEALG